MIAGFTDLRGQPARVDAAGELRGEGHEANCVVADELVDLGVDLSMMQTVGDLQGGLEEGLPDVKVVPDLATLTDLPWEPGAAWSGGGNWRASPARTRSRAGARPAVSGGSQTVAWCGGGGPPAARATTVAARARVVRKGVSFMTVDDQ